MQRRLRRAQPAARHAAGDVDRRVQAVRRGRAVREVQGPLGPARLPRAGEPVHAGPAGLLGRGRADHRLAARAVGRRARRAPARPPPGRGARVGEAGPVSRSAASTSSPGCSRASATGRGTRSSRSASSTTAALRLTTAWTFIAAVARGVVDDDVGKQGFGATNDEEWRAPALIRRLGADAQVRAVHPWLLRPGVRLRGRRQEQAEPGGRPATRT